MAHFILVIGRTIVLPIVSGIIELEGRAGLVQAEIVVRESG